MEKVINLLSDIEEKANQIVKRASEEKVKLQESFEEEIALLDQSIAAENAQKLSALQAQVDKELDLDKQALIDDCNKHLADMEEQYKQNHDAIVDKIFESLIKA